MIVGASRGLGYSLSKALIGPKDRAYLISRNRPDICDDERIIWLPIDLSISNESNMVLLDKIGNDAIDVLIYNAGIWEEEGFSETPVTELMNILNVGLNSSICIIKALENNLIRAKGYLVLDQCLGKANLAALLALYEDSARYYRSQNYVSTLALNEQIQHRITADTCFMQSTQKTINTLLLDYDQYHGGLGVKHPVGETATLGLHQDITMVPYEAQRTGITL